MSLRFSAAALIAATVALLAGPALARCSKNLVERLGPGAHFASLDVAQLAAGGEASPNRALITFVGHASYQIDTPEGVRAITDYNGVNGFGRNPDIVTMNNAHTTHFTDEPEDGITFILKGWPSEPGETEAKHDVRLKDMRVWNVPTNARDWGGSTARINGNSIFIFSDRRPLHRPSRPPASPPDQGASRADRPDRRADGADRRLLHHGRAVHGRRHQVDRPEARAADALLGQVPARSLRWA